MIDSYILNGCATSSRLVKTKLVCILLSSAENSATNAWNINTQTGQVNNNNNNKYNANVVRPVVAFRL